MTEQKKPAPKKQAKKSDKPVVRIASINGALLPTKATDGSAAYDVYAAVGHETQIPNKQTFMIPAGFAVEIEQGYCMKLYARSGLAHKEGLVPSNCVGIIDSDYRGQVMVSLTNTSNTGRKIQPNQRIAQAMIEKVIEPEWVEVESVEKLQATERGKGGFGSTGKAKDS